MINKIKNINKKIISFMLVASLMMCQIPLVFAVAGEGTITIYHTNDIHGKVDSQYKSNGELSQIGMDVLKTVKSQTRNSLLVDSGDPTQGSTIATYSRGSDIIKMMNAAGYDGMVVGNHEFDYGLDSLKGNVQLATFPIIGANVVSKATNEPFLKGINGSNGSNFIKEINGKKIGFFGILSEDTADKSRTEHVKGIEFASSIDYSKDQIAKLKKEGAQVIVGLTHVGLNNSTEITSEVLAHELTGIDIILDGHSHDEFTKEVNGIIIQQTGTNSKKLGKIEINFDSDGKIQISAKLISALEVGKTYKPDSSVTKLYDHIYEIKKPIVERTVAKTAHSLYGGTYFGKSVARMVETNMGDLVADLILNEGKELANGKDSANIEGFVALQNSGGVRDTIEAGYITVDSINKVLPNDNYIEVKQITPSGIYKALENGVCKLTKPSSKGEAFTGEDGRFPQVAGMRFEFDINKKAYDSNNKNSVGERIIKIVLLNEDGTDKKEIYRDDNETKILLASNNFTLEGGEGYAIFKEYPTLFTGDTVEAVVEKGIKNIVLKDGQPIMYPLMQNRSLLIKTDDLYGNYDSEIVLKNNDLLVNSENVKVSVDYKDSVIMKTDESGKIILKDLDTGMHSVKIEYKNMESETCINECVGLKNGNISFYNTTEEDAESVSNLIDQIQNKTENQNEEFISFTRNCYDSLSEEAKAKVMNYKILTTHEENINKLQNKTNYKIVYNIIYIVVGLALVVLIIFFIINKRNKRKRPKRRMRYK